MKHKHHAIPKHIGGSDDSANLIELTVEEHAEAHRRLFIEHGRWQDELAWKGLSGQISTQDLIRESQKKGQLNRIKTQEERNKISKNNGMKRPAVAAKVAAQMIGNKNSLGHKNALGNRTKHSKGNFKWITNLIIEKQIPKDHDLPPGFTQGRLRTAMPR